MTNEELRKAQENTLRVATNLSVMLSDKDVLIPTKFAQATVEAQQLIAGFIEECKKSLEDSKLVAATPEQTAALNLVK